MQVTNETFAAFMSGQIHVADNRPNSWGATNFVGKVKGTRICEDPPHSNGPWVVVSCEWVMANFPGGWDTAILPHGDGVTREPLTQLTFPLAEVMAGDTEVVCFCGAGQQGYFAVMYTAEQCQWYPLARIGIKMKGAQA